MASSSDHPPSELMGVHDTEGVLVLGCWGVCNVGSRFCTRHSWSVSWIGDICHLVLLEEQ